MAVQDYKINYKSDFVLTINGDAGWAVPFCIKFWTGMPSQAYFVGFDGVKYVNCRVGDTPTQLLVMFDDHHLPIGKLKMQIAYHTTIEEFPGSVFDEVTNARDVIVNIDGTDYQVLLDFTGEDAPELEFDLPAYANEAERIQNELQRQQNEADRIAAELQREQATAAAVQGAENVNAQLNGTTLTVTNRQGVSTSVNTKGEQGEQGPVGPEGPQGEQGPKGEKGDTGATGPQGIQGPAGPQGQTGVSITDFVKTGETETDTLYDIEFSDDTTKPVAIPKGEKGDQGEQGPEGPQGPMGDVAVITPEQQAAFTIYSTTGQNTDGPMTQKAVTDELTIAQNKTISYTQASGWLNLADGATAYAVLNNMVTRYIPVVAGNTYQVSGSYSGAIYARIGFATSVPASGVSATVIYSVTFQGGFTKTYKPTSDGYLSISHFNQSGMNAAVFKLIGTPLKGAVKELSDEVDDLDGQINDKSISYTPVNKLNQAGGTTYVSANNYQTRYIPVKAGFTYIATFKTTTSGSTHYVRFASSNNIPANGVSSTFLTQLNAANTVVSFEYTAVNDGYLSVSYSHSASYTYVSTFTQLAGKSGLGTAKAELIPVGGAMIAINTVYPADNTPRVIIPRTSYIVYKDKVLHLSDVYSQDITISLTGLSGVLRVSFDSNAHTFAAKLISSDFGKTEMEVFTIDLATGNVTLPDNFYRFNGVIGAGKEKRFYQASNKLGFTGNTLHTYDAINFGFPTIDGAQYVDDNGGWHALGDIAIYANELFAFYQDGYVNVYNISDFKNVTLNGTFKLQTDIHSNGAQFAPTVLEGETYPLIYVANGVQAGGGDFTAVEQIKKVNGVYTSELVQTITVTNTPDYKINTIIGDDGYFWAIGCNGNTSNIFYYAKFLLPDISSPTVSLNYNNAIEKWTENKSYSVAPYVQGLCICQGKVFQVLGNGAPFNEIHVVDLNTRIALTDIVLTDYDQTKMQGCDVYKGCLIVSRNFGKGFTLIPLGDSASESGVSNNPFKGKRLGIIGDSISTYSGSMPSGYANYYTDSNLGSISNIWWNIVCRKLGMSFTNCSWSGSLVEGNSGSSSAQAGCSTKRIQDLGANGTPDVIICFISCNDWRYGPDNNYTLGTWKVSDPINVTDRNITNFREAYAVMLYKLTTTYKNAKIFVCTNLDDPRRDQTAGWPSNNSDGISTYEWNQNIREIGEALGATVIDVHSCGLTFANMPDYCVDSDTPEPGTHPGVEGQAMIASKVIAQLLSNCY